MSDVGRPRPRRLPRVLPLLMLPLGMVACALASAPWLRSFPASVMAVPLFGAAVLSVLVPVVVNGIGVRRLWLTAPIDAALLVFYEMFVTLRDPGGFAQLYSGAVHGPAQLLSFALPLVSPRTLLVAPVALCWISGAVIGECTARGWRTVLPYAGLLITLGLSYAATTRAITSADVGRRSDTLIAAALLLVILVQRAVGAWIAQNSSVTAESPDSALPVRSVAIGVVLAVAVAALAGVVVQAPAFSRPPVTATRQAPINRASLLTPLSFIAGLRPSSATSRGRELFRMITNRPSSNYIGIASVDVYDGDGWTFDRTFRPSGGVLPADTTPQLRSGGPRTEQQYRISAGLNGSAWLPSLYRARGVTGVSVDVDPTSGMIVPSRALHSGETYSVVSAATSAIFSNAGPSTSFTGISATDVTLPANPTLTQALRTLVTTLSAETGVAQTSKIAFLQAVARDFRTRSALASTVPSRSSASPSTSPSQLGAPAAQHAGSTGFADVLASIRQFRSATPEQFATLMCLIARSLQVPARIATGFRVPLPRGAATLPAGSHGVTSAQAWSWVELPVSGHGWEVLDPSPSTHAALRPQAPSAAQPTPTPTPTPSRSALITRGNQTQGHAIAPRSRVPRRAVVSGHTLVVVLAVLVGLLVLSVIAFLATRKTVRRRRRRGAVDPRHRLLGAWHESLDLLEEAGLADLDHASSRDITQATDARFGAQPAAQVRYLGDVANRAIFRPSAPVESADADSAWQAHRVLHRAVREHLGWRSRLRTGLRYHHRRTSGSRRAPMREHARH